MENKYQIKYHGGKRKYTEKHLEEFNEDEKKMIKLISGIIVKYVIRESEALKNEEEKNRKTQLGISPSI